MAIEMKRIISIWLVITILVIALVNGNALGSENDGDYHAEYDGTIQGSSPSLLYDYATADEPFPVGAGAKRFVVTVSSDKDVDLYIEDPDGTIVESSTTAETTETIEITNPSPAGEWTVIVHHHSNQNSSFNSADYHLVIDVYHDSATEGETEDAVMDDNSDFAVVEKAKIGYAFETVPPDSENTKYNDSRDFSIKEGTSWIHINVEYNQSGWNPVSYTVYRHLTVTVFSSDDKECKNKTYTDTDEDVIVIEQPVSGTWKVEVESEGVGDPEEGQDSFTVTVFGKEPKNDGIESGIDNIGIFTIGVVICAIILVCVLCVGYVKRKEKEERVITRGKISLFTSVLAVLITIVGLIISYNQLADRTFSVSLVASFVTTVIWWVTIAVLVDVGGRILEGYIKEKRILWSYWVVPFYLIILGLLVLAAVDVINNIDKGIRALPTVSLIVKIVFAILTGFIGFITYGYIKKHFVVEEPELQPTKKMPAPTVHPAPKTHLRGRRNAELENRLNVLRGEIRRLIGYHTEDLKEEAEKVSDMIKGGYWVEAGNALISLEGRVVDRKVEKEKYDQFMIRVNELVKERADFFVDDIKAQLSKGDFDKAEQLLGERRRDYERYLELGRSLKDVEEQTTRLSVRLANGELTSDAYERASDALERKKKDIDEEMWKIQRKIFREKYEKPF